ncbi:CaiB/BaiF CoA transferase family protein [Roseospirillum parvum]|uniref:Crotonobetainyl-CoA:carnitine CoA-transferase CaiB n=1 Tax=Roseospirillum parvum TaxID=83401 RepID=A0A1G8BYH9_9PROT|nr:CoA transferase [Roseospirillum parvum]SDH37760.1 Crotonobetainyl-CoA:carnitine CoA-transferase CaiB [Roseospirillum parvum]
MSGPCLAGLRVLDLSQYLPGPFATLMLVDFGAEVVKVEPPAGDPMRGLEPIGADGEGLSWRAVNGGKTVVRLDLKDPADQDRLARLVERADVLLESFRPGVMARLGFAAERLAELNPRLVHCALTGWGYTGPRSKAAGHEIGYAAAAGALDYQGPAAAPCASFPPVGDMVAGLSAALAILAAVLRARAEGQGAFLDCSIFESVLALQFYPQTLALNGPLGREESVLNGGAACYRVYRAADGRFVSLGALEAKFWAAFCRAVGREDWVARQAEPMPQTDLIGEVADLFAAHPLAHWQAVLAEADCCFEPLLTPEEVRRDPHVVARGLVHGGDAPGGAVEVAAPVLIDGAPPPRRAAPRECPAEAVLAAWG